MKMKKLIAMALCLVLLVGMLAGCSSKAPEAQQSSEPAAASSNADTASKGTVKFGLIAPLNGSNAEFGTTYQTAVAMAVDEIMQTAASTAIRWHLMSMTAKATRPRALTYAASSATIPT